ncbi:CinA family protein [Acholeplasma sp. OttesenSCG-928-E16]|nr:CinA family protein [Acholeplasma sp. OttesenSCG-928-E16]
MIKDIIDFLEDNGLTIAFAESMTGGYAAYSLIQNPGASKVLKASFITYSNESKTELLDIDPADIKKYSIVSEEIAIKMAKAVSLKCNADIGVGITGNAGPTLQSGTEDYVACIGIYYNEEEYKYRFSLFGLKRKEAIEKTVIYVYEKLTEILL